MLCNYIAKTTLTVILLFLLCNRAALLYGVVARATRACYLQNVALYCIYAIVGSDVCLFGGFVNFDVVGREFSVFVCE